MLVLLAVAQTAWPDEQRLPSNATAEDILDALLGGPGTCTEESAALVGAICTEEGPDADRDGLVSVAAALVFPTQ